MGCVQCILPGLANADSRMEHRSVRTYVEGEVWQESTNREMNGIC